MSEKFCQFKPIHDNEIGSVNLCTKCGNVRVEIGTMLALISKKAFRLILEDFQERQQFYEENEEAYRAGSKLHICLNKQNLFLTLTKKEMDLVIQLFEVANHMLEVEEILTLEL
jgi:hypothetical protein